MKLFYVISVSGLCKSSFEVRKKIVGGVVCLDEDCILDYNLIFNFLVEFDGKVLWVGKKNFIWLVES